MKSLYLANPYGFSKQQKEVLLPTIKEQIKKLNIDVWEPFKRNNQVDFSKKGWAKKVGIADVQDVINSDGIFAIVNGTPPDEGVMVELGIIIGYNALISKGLLNDIPKEIFLFRDDFRRCTDSEEYPLNLMLFADFSIDENSELYWKKHFYSSVDEILCEEKSLYKWSKK